MSTRDLNHAVSGVRDGEAVSFTPGPWSITARDGTDIHVTAPDDGAPDEPWNIAVAIGACGYPDDPRTGCTEANARLIAAAPDHHEAAREIDRLMLVIESAVRYADPGNYAAVLAALKANQAALAKALGPSAADTSERSVPARDEAKS